jgi:hypothetical protein
LVNSINPQWKDLFEEYFGDTVTASNSEAAPLSQEIASPKSGSQ